MIQKTDPAYFECFIVWS